MKRRHAALRMQDELAALATKAERPVTLYLIGGGKLALQGIKDATKDVDVVVENEQDLGILTRALEATGYEPLDDPGTAYLKMGVRRVFAKGDAPQWDLFVSIVCGKLTLSPSMRPRSKPWRDDAERLHVRLVSPEDIFVFKSITDREADRDDQEALIASGLDWKVIMEEMRWQVRHAAQPWTREFLEAMEELGQRGNLVPILDDLKALDDETMAEWAVLHVLGARRMTRSEILSACREDDAGGRRLVGEAIDRLADRGAVRAQGGRYAAATYRDKGGQPPARAGDEK